MNKKHYLVTGGTGFIGSALVRRLVQAGHRITILDDNSRGDTSRIADVIDRVRLVHGDVRNAQDVEGAAVDCNGVIHLAFVNGTEFFYSKPDLVLDVAVKGIVNVIDACLKHGIRELVLASSSEVYQTPPCTPTDENVPLVVPDVLNPRYSYTAGKLISEVMAINYGRKYFDRVLVFRPHNVFGPDMGWEHVVPQFSLRMARIVREHANSKRIRFPIQGSGEQTRSFICIDDFSEGFMCMLERGEHLGIYHIGTMEEVSIGDLARMVGACFDRDIDLVESTPAAGGTLRRCPDTTKLKNLGFEPKYCLRDALPSTVRWYDENRHKEPIRL